MNTKFPVNEETQPALKVVGVNGSVYFAGQFVNYPKLLLDGNKMQCPICGRFWEKFGGGYGFVKKSAGTHIASCFEKSLKSQGLEMKQPYNMEKLSWELQHCR